MYLFPGYRSCLPHHLFRRLLPLRLPLVIKNNNLRGLDRGDAFISANTYRKRKAKHICRGKKHLARNSEAAVKKMSCLN